MPSLTKLTLDQCKTKEVKSESESPHTSATHAQLTTSRSNPLIHGKEKLQDIVGFKPTDFGVARRRVIFTRAMRTLAWNLYSDSGGGDSRLAISDAAVAAPVATIG
jgi:hypothetical protein